MNIVTACDSGFFFCLKELAKSVRKFYGKPVIVYDLGLTKEEKQQLDAVIIPIELNEKVDYKKSAHIFPDGRSSCRNTHKPFCARDYFQKFNEPMILVDADCLFTEKVELDGFDVAVTLDPKKISRKDMYNGVIYSGVMFFNCPAEKLVDRWEQECMTENTTDQKALSDILSDQIVWKNYKKIQQWNGLKIKILDTNVYNDFHLKGGKILHFATTKHDKDVFSKLIEGYEQGKNIRKIFLRVKRGKKSLPEKIGEFLGIVKKD
ncbi:MAG: putative nucleotide-diphospho-sugar transferase [Phycisphaerae bacterium]|nr:putative nucleotide-diphospho-sugar transferase [Phycisphaerae bacterium]